MTARSLVARARAAWRARWFPDAPLADLAIARVLLVAIVLYLDDRGLRFLNIARAPAMTWDPVSFLALLDVTQPAAWVVRALASATQVALLAAAAGLATNVALGCAFVLQLVLEGLLNSFGKYTHATIPLLYAMLFFALAPCGRVWSVDALIRRVRARGMIAHAPPPRTSRFARWPFELLLLELASYYFAAGFTKLSVSGLAWADGSTLQYHALQHGTVVGGWLALHPWLCTVLSAAALAFELGFPLAVVLRRLRPWFLAAGVCFHVGNDLVLDLLFWPVFAVYALVVPWSLLQRRAATLLHRYGASLRARLARGSPT